LSPYIGAVGDDFGTTLLDYVAQRDTNAVLTWADAAAI